MEIKQKKAYKNYKKTFNKLIYKLTQAILL